MERTMGKATKAKRVYETVVDACAHRVTVNWWNITGPVTDEQLEEAAEARIRECVAEDYASGQLVFDDGKSSATGWWDTRGERS
jgi:hypothetical protein